jgi:hypothetical protein
VWLLETLLRIPQPSTGYNRRELHRLQALRPSLPRRVLFANR